MAKEIEADIFSRVIDASYSTLSINGANGILQLNFLERDHERMAELAERSNEGTLTHTERREQEAYLFVGDVLAMMKSKARLSLARRS